MTNSQISFYKDKCIREYQTIAHTLFKDLSQLSIRDVSFSNELNNLLDGYTVYYRQNNIIIEITDMSWHGGRIGSENDNGISTDVVMTYIVRDNDYFIFITGVLSAPFQHFRFDYYYNITDHISEIQSIHNILLIICISFSILAAFALYFIINVIFKPLGIVSKASKQIANGQYIERIIVKGKNELSNVADDFNKMAEIIERQILTLEDEATSKQQFIDNFAHEIRTPLTSILGNAEYMQKAVLDEGEIIELSQLIINSTNHMRQIADSLLELATLRNYTPIKTEIQIQKLFEEIKQTLDKPLRENNVNLICNTELNIIEGQEDLIKSMLLNLVTNAIKALTQEKTVTHTSESQSPQENRLHIILEAKIQDGKKLFIVTDNGCGISEKSLPRIMEPFYRVDTARSREHSGGGLGLTLCKQIADTHGFEIKIESIIDEGTTVTIICEESFTTP
jgi:signal transduction histidine kinase